MTAGKVWAMLAGDIPETQQDLFEDSLVAEGVVPPPAQLPALVPTIYFQDMDIAIAVIAEDSCNRGVPIP